MSKLLVTLCFIALFIYVIAEEESKNKAEESMKSENGQEEFDNANKGPEASDSKYMKQNMEAPANYIPLYYGYIPFYELIGY